jgi:hypothetical protein
MANSVVAVADKLKQKANEFRRRELNWNPVEAQASRSMNGKIEYDIAIYRYIST